VTLFQNVRILNGKHGNLSKPSHVLVSGNVIERISGDAISCLLRKQAGRLRSQ
jgi:hypothetical protein